MTEYALMLAAIAVVVYAIYAAKGNNIGSLASGIEFRRMRKETSRSTRKARRPESPRFSLADKQADTVLQVFAREDVAHDPLLAARIAKLREMAIRAGR